MKRKVKNAKRRNDVGGFGGGVGGVGGVIILFFMKGGWLNY